jgi:hypothetical protein
MKLPVMAFQRADTAAITAAPPPTDRRRREKSTSPIRGCIVRPAYSVLTPVKTVGRASFITSTKPFMSRGLATSQFSAPIEK